MTDPAAMEGMMGMMKGNMAMMVPQTLIMGWINAFFAGFVVCESVPVWLYPPPPTRDGNVSTPLVVNSCYHYCILVWGLG